MAKKKFSYKVPSIVALTLAGTALATHHQAEASEVTQDDNKNVLDDEQTLKHAGEIKEEVSQPTANISGTQVYKDPSMIHNNDSDDEALQYDAALDELDASTEDEADASNEDSETTQAINQQDEELQSTQETDEDAKQDVETSEKENEETELQDATSQENDSSEETELEQQSENDDTTTDDQQGSDDKTAFESSTHNQEDADKAQAANHNTYQDDETSAEEKQYSTAQDDEVHSSEDNTLDTDEADTESLEASQQDNESTEADYETSNDKEDATDEVSDATKQEEADVTEASSSSQAETNAEAEDKDETSEQQETDVEKQKDGQTSESADNQKENTKRNQVESDETTVKDEIENDEADKETAGQASTAKSEQQEDQTEASQLSGKENKDVTDKDETQNDAQDEQQESENDEADQSSEASNKSEENEATDDATNSDEHDEPETQVKSDENESPEATSDQNDQDDHKSQHDQLAKDDEEQATDEEAESEDQEDASSLENDDAQSDNDIVESDETDETESSAVTTYRLDDEQNTNEVRLHSLSSNQPTTPLGASSQQGNTEENVPVTLNRSASPRVATTRQAQVQGSSREANERATSSLPKYEPQVESPINDYIRQQNFPVPEYEDSIADFLPKNSYRYGRPEGIVMHDTANDNSTIDSEINYMKNNYNAAFVHAFVDGDHIIETANTDYGAWGAGPYANERFIHVELVHTHDFESFARSINNYADYAATNLQYYGLEPDSAEYDGQGTVWTHNAVSNHLGGTDHTDPIGYLEANNYSYDELYDLINEKYLIKEGKVAPWSTEPHSSTTPKPADKPSKPSNTTDNQSSGLTVTPLADAIGTVAKDNHGLYSTVYDEVGTQNNTIGGNTYKLSKKATLNDDAFYLINDAGNDLGWVQDEDILDKKYNTSQTHKDAEEETKSNAPAKAAQEETKYISSSKKDSTKKDNSSDKKESSNKKDSAKKDSSSSKKESSSKKDSNKKDSSSDKKESSSKKDSNKKDSSSDKKESSSKKDSNKKDTNKQSTVKTTSVNQLGQVKSNNNGIYATIYDEESKPADNIANKTYKVTKKAEYNNESFVLLQNVNQPTPIGWVKAEDVKARPLGKTKTKNGEYKVKRKNDGLYSVPMGTKDQLLDPLDGDKNYKFKASKAVKVGDDEYVYGSVNNKTGWIAGDDLKQNKSSNNQTNTPKAEPSRHKTLVINNKDGEYYTSPNASSGKSLADYYNSAFSIIGKAKVEGETWYYGTLSNGKKVWIKSDDLAKSVINYLKTGMTLDEAVSLQFEMGANPQIQHNAGTWDDASYAEVKQAMDTEGLAHDATQKYQFLRLDKPQNIAVNDLNKLLDGKGILAGQGEAFSEAANTYGLNEVYLISHALLETGNGTSTLATGGNADGSNKKYYNMYGIGAYDHDAITTGFNYAKAQGWDTVKKAIVGGAQFIAGSFIQDGQNTLYKMRWNPDNPGTHQYATDVNWARQNASIMKQMYDAMDEAGKFFDVDTYKK
ncbi:glucosaminidase domain-containing protein [Staphylococcus auricularis]|uniref:glucosaminidase domain-containing protein n=1 Tax=Staphylococcus auricularis TaxID=29379 RepID=UPI001F15FE60|nr:GW dipeptide domain-containing protein [Staphylococcus auricularis]MCE5037718.1 glucosaminidase domain-containing protein [Staphylococcus auricularis]